MRIAMIGQKGIASGGRSGGVERHVREISARLALIGHDIFVYARRKYHPDQPVTFEGMYLLYIPTLYTKHLEAIVHTFFSTVHALYKSYDIIHYHGVGPATLAWIVRLFSPKTTVIVTFHSIDRFHQKWGFFARAYLRFGEWAAVHFSHYCISVSHEMQVYAREQFHVEAVYIPNGANLKEVDSESELERFCFQKHSYFLNVGRIVPQKGLELLIESYRKLETDFPLVIVGAPSYSQEYYAYLRKQAKGDHRICFVGFQEGETLDQLYAHAFAYVHPSHSEGLPLVILEAMSFGLLPIVSDIASNVEAIHNTGMTFETGNARDLREKLQFALDHPAFVRAQAEEVRAVVETHFHWDTITDHIEAVYITARH